MDPENPAQAAEATQGAEETAPSTDVATDATSASAASVPAPVAPSQPQTTEAPKGPDVDALLGNEDFNNRLLKHDRVRETFKTIRKADVEAQARTMLTEWQQAEAARKAREDEERRLEEMDSFDLGEHVKAQTKEQKAHQAAMVAALAQIGQATHAWVQRAPFLSEEDRAELAPHAYADYHAYLNALVERSRSSTEREAQVRVREAEARVAAEWQAKLDAELAKMPELVRKEAEAQVQERLKDKRDAGPAPKVLPPAEGATSDADFLARYSSVGYGSLTLADYQRAKRLLDL